MIDVACQTDVQLLPDCAVMLRSLLTTNREEQFRVHFLCDARTPNDEWQPLARVVTSLGGEWSLTPIESGRLERLPFAPAYGGYVACYRLLLPDLLPGTPKVLYLDADIVVLDLIRPLWDIDMDGCCVAATTNPLYRLMQQRVKIDLGLPDHRAYFNSGVLLFDLDAMRAEGLDQALLDWAVAHREKVAWPDQDVLNAVLWRRRLPLHPRWNAAGGLWDLPKRDLPWTADEVDEARRHPAIAHFVGPFKPWHYRCTHPYRVAFHTHLTRIEVPPRPVAGRTLRNSLARRLPPLAQWTLTNGTAELRAEMKYRVLSSAIGGEARVAYRRFRRCEPDPATLVLEALDATVRDVAFVQVGSNDGDHDDPLRPFTMAGQWRGVLVEPVPYLFDRLRNNYRHRPGIVPVNAAIGPYDGTAEFFAVVQEECDDELPEWYDQIGSFSKEHILKHADYIPGLEERIVGLKVRTLTFDTLCKEYGITRIDVLHVDAEGYDFEIIKALDFDRQRPTLLMYEYKHLSDNDRAACRQVLEGAGYDMLDVAWDTLALHRTAITHRRSRLARAWRTAAHRE